MATIIGIDSSNADAGGGGNAVNIASQSVHSNNTVSKRFMEGPLSKWTNVVNGWQYRWFVLDQDAGLLSYYTVSIPGQLTTGHSMCG